METMVYKTDTEPELRQAVKAAGELLREGKLVAIPTETVYGLAANALDPQAVNAIFKAKGRPNDNPLIVHIADLSALPDVVSVVPEKARVLMERFWPGPLTIVLPRNPQIPNETTAGLDTVAVRMPSHPVAQAIIRESGLPIAGALCQSVRPAQPHHSGTLCPGSHRQGIGYCGRAAPATSAWNPPSSPWPGTIPVCCVPAP